MSKPGAVQGFRRSLAILVAIDDYVGGVPTLQTPVADAEELARVLRDEHGFDIQIIKNANATYEKLKALLTDLQTRVGKDDRVLFYFAGHGIALESDDGPKGYILPQDADQVSTDRYLPMVDLNQALSTLPCRHMLVILDCCFAGALRWASPRDLILARTNLHRERYEWFIHDAAWQAIASAAHDQKALDIAAGQPLGTRDQATLHSPFAEALIDGLTGLADLRSANQPGDGVITATELLVYLRDRLMPLPGSGRPRQTPMLWPLPKHDKGEFVFLVPGRDLDLPSAPPLDSNANPWLGLQTYDSSQSELFFGRRSFSETLLARVLRDPLVVVTGPSGIGKSSLLRAGLLPRLKNLPIVPIIVRPGPAPFAALAAALRGEGRADIEEQALRADPMALAKWFAEHHDQQFLLIIDQAEELITQNRDTTIQNGFLALIENALSQEGPPAEIHHFAEADARAAIEAMGYTKVTVLQEDDSGDWCATAEKDDKPVEAAFEIRRLPLRVALTVRSEFEPQFAQSPLNKRWTASRSLVPRMTQDELRRVIEGPASVKVIRFESAALVDQLVNEVVEMPGALPVLSFALSQMYKNFIERRGGDRSITFLDYDALQGGVTGSLRARANEVVDAADEKQRETARRVLERFVSLEAGAFARRRVPKRELDAEEAVEANRVEEIIDRLVKERLIITDEIDGEPYLELAHDALILGWDRLLGWVREDATRIVALRLLTPNAEEWATSQREKSGLLWSDAARRETIAELQVAPSPGLNKTEKAFARASIRRARRNRITGWSIAAALALSTIGAGWFGYQARQDRDLAQQQQQLAQEQQQLAQQQQQVARSAEQQARQSAEEASHREASARALLEIQSNPAQGLETAMGAFKQNLDSRRPLLTEAYSSAWKALDAAREVKRIYKARPWLNGVRAIVPSPDESRLLVATAGAIQILDMEGRQLIAPIGDDEQVNTDSTAAAWQPNGEHFVVAQGLGEGLRLYNADGTFVRTLLSRPGVDITACLFIDEAQVAAGTSDGRLIVVSIDGNLLNERQLSETSAIAGVAMSHDLIIGAEAPRKDDSSAARVDDASDQKPASTAKSEPNFEVLPNLFPPGARCLVKAPAFNDLLAVCGSEGRVDLWDTSYSTKGYEHKRTIQAHAGKVNAIAFHPSGKIMATAGDDGLIRLFSANGEAIQTPIRRSGSSGAVNALAFVDNGNKLISDCDDALCMWDLGDTALPKPIGVYDELSSVDRNTGMFFVGEKPSDGGWTVKAVTSTGEVRVVSSSPEGKLRALQYGQKSNLLAFVIDDKVSVLDLASGATVWSNDIPADGDVRLAFAKEDSWLGAVISQEPRKFIPSENIADRHSDIRFLVFDASKGEKLAEKQHQSPTPIVDMVGVIKDSSPRFITVAANGVLEQWSAELAILKTDTSLQLEQANGAMQRSRLTLLQGNKLLLAAVGLSIGIFDVELNPKGSVRRLDKTIDALSASPDSQFFAIIAHTERLGISEESTKVLRVYDVSGQFVVERALLGSSSGDHPLYFGESNITTLQSSDGLISWPMGPKTLSDMGTKRLAYYATERKRTELESLANKAFKDRRYRESTKLFSEAIDIDPINSDQHALLGNALIFGAEGPEDWEAAEKAYSHGIAVLPYDPILFLQRGKERFRTGRFAEAEDDFSSGAKFSRFSLPVVSVVAGFLGINQGIHNLSRFIAKVGINEFYLRRAITRFAQKKWVATVDDINLIEQTFIDIENWQRTNWPESKSGSLQLGPLQLDYRGRALFELGRYDEAYRDLKGASDKLMHDEGKYDFEDLVSLTGVPGAREAKRGEILALAAEAARRSGEMQKAADALSESKSSYGTAISKSPNRRLWQDALAILP